VVAATASVTANDDIVREANERGILLNVVDDQTRSSFYFTANYRDGDVLRVGLNGGCLASLAQWVRARVAQALPKNLAPVARRLREERSKLHEAGESTERRPWSQRVSELVDEFGDNENSLARD